MATDEEREPGCPKRMVYGPCGGVRPGGACEVADVACPFATLTRPIPWDGPTRTGGAPAGGGFADRTAPLVLTDLTVAPYDREGLATVVGLLAGSCDAVLVGDHQSRPDFPPTQIAGLVDDAGGAAVITLSCRDRNRVVLEQELEGLAAIGVAGVMCVTGDARGPGVRRDATQVFDLDGTRLAGLAAARGLPVVVPESPDAPPVALRPRRLVEKQRAGATLCILNHSATVDHVRRFVEAARRAGATVPIVGAVPVFTDAPSAGVLQRFPGLALRAEHVETVLGAEDTVAAGIAVAVAEARALLAIEGVVGVNLSGMASGRGVETGAEIKAAIGAALREEAA
ncbi:methylenetetrahydrofolate reductase C-terminal domain-containing protein [Iamia sp. SCSIO 61187]|uniref:methylenetetrahydrofolate reductase C-terminal domain-containing protein n=1 Tax=Iamia sp. SCSIO 61187 TaxID=2722752 RepID=UPI001C639869|nr:methylenetetrahydrofolate reductase C-terminal domain-containing protein [Iamia sp. SCSIO 61187]